MVVGVGPGQAFRMTTAPSPTPSSADQPTGTPPGPVAQSPLRRSSTDRMLGGVCGGLAQHTGIDALLWRVGFVGLTVTGGAGVLVYLVLWVLMPAGPTAAGEEPHPVDRLVERLHTAVSDIQSPSRRG
jgi:phage shock protein C